MRSFQKQNTFSKLAIIEEILTNVGLAYIIQSRLKYYQLGLIKQMAKTTIPELADILKVLGDPSRLAIFDLLMQGIQCNCELGTQLKMPMNLISHHLKVLRDAGLVDAERDETDARWIYYSVNQKAIAQLCQQLDTFLDIKRIQTRQPACGPRVLVEKMVTARH